MDVDAAFVADRQAAEAGDPGERTLHHPAVPARALAALDPAPGDARDDAALPAGTAAAAVVVGLVGVRLRRAPSGSAPRLADRRHGIERLLQHGAVVDVRGREQDGQGDALPVDHEVALAARLAAVGFGPLAAPPALAGRLALSSEHRLRSISPALPSRSSSAWWNARQMPARCQSRSRRQQLIPQPQPISCGSISQGMPDLSTNRMPVSAARSPIGGRPPFGRGGRGGSKGPKRDQRASETRGAAIRP